MSKPYIHAQSSVRKFGGKIEDYEPIHAFMDCSKGAIADNRHRALTHNSWFLSNILERVKFANSGPILILKSDVTKLAKSVNGDNKNE